MGNSCVFKWAVRLIDRANDLLQFGIGHGTGTGLLSVLLFWSSLARLNCAEEEDEASAPGVGDDEHLVNEGVGESDGEAMGEGVLEQEEPVGEWLRSSQ